MGQEPQWWSKHCKPFQKKEEVKMITAALGKKKTEEASTTMKVKTTGKDASKDRKKEELSVSSKIEQKPNKTKKGSFSSTKGKGAPNLLSYSHGIDIPLSD